MSSFRRAFVLGGRSTIFTGKGHPSFVHKKHPDFGKRQNPTLEELIETVINDALKAVGIEAASVDRSVIGNFAGELFCKQGHLGAAVAGSHKDLLYKPSYRTEAACASGGVAFVTALESIRAGTADIALVVGAEVQNTVSAREGGDFLATAAHYRVQRALDDFTFPALFAKRMKSYRTAYNLSEKEIASVVVKAYENGNKNPLAHMHKVKMSLENASQASDSNPAFLSNAELKPWLKVSDCSQVSDGASALILVSEKGLQKLNKKMSDAIEVAATSVAAGNLYVDGDDLSLDTTRHAAKSAYETASLGPNDIHIAEVHDCFSIAEILMYEALGFAEKGQGVKLALSGATSLEGRIPVNTGGGLIAFGHPVGATGVKQILEIYNQMKGKAGDYQVKKIPKVGLTANMGGNDKTVVINILKNL